MEFHDTDPIPYEQPLNVIPAATERNNLSVAEPMKLSVGSFHLTIPNGTDPQLLYTVNHPYYSNFKPPFPAARF